jgi:hypothetical protein
MLSHVVAPMIRACPVVTKRKWAMSSGASHPRVPEDPIAPPRPTATTAANEPAGNGGSNGSCDRSGIPCEPEAAVLTPPLGL